MKMSQGCIRTAGRRVSDARLREMKVLIDHTDYGTFRVRGIQRAWTHILHGCGGLPPASRNMQLEYHSNGFSSDWPKQSPLDDVRLQHNLNIFYTYLLFFAPIILHCCLLKAYWTKPMGVFGWVDLIPYSDGIGNAQRYVLRPQQTPKMQLFRW